MHRPVSRSRTSRMCSRSACPRNCPGGLGDHGYLSRSRTLVEDLAPVDRFDPRACGCSTGGRPFTVTRWTGDLERLRSRCGHESWMLVGHRRGCRRGEWRKHQSQGARSIGGRVWTSCQQAGGRDLDTRRTHRGVEDHDIAFRRLQLYVVRISSRCPSPEPDGVSLDRPQWSCVNKGTDR